MLAVRRRWFTANGRWYEPLERLLRLLSWWQPQRLSPGGTSEHSSDWLARSRSLPRRSCCFLHPSGNSFCAPASTVPSSTGGQCDFLTTDHRPVVHRPPQVNGQPVRRRFVFAPWRAGASSPAAQTPEGRLTALTWPVRRFKMHDSWQRKGEEP